MTTENEIESTTPCGIQLAVALVLAVILMPWSGTCESYRYEIKSFGSRNALVTVTGQDISLLTAAPSTDGRTIRFSSPNGIFQGPTSDQIQGDLISSIRQTRRGLTTDLIFNLAGPSTIKVSQRSQGLEVFLRAKRAESEATNPPNSKNVDTETPSPKAVSAPQGQSSGAHPPVILAMPAPSAIGGITPLSNLLRLFAYFVDLPVLALAESLSISLSTPSQCTSERVAIEERERKHIEELEKLQELVGELTEELISLRNG